MARKNKPVGLAVVENAGGSGRVAVRGALTIYHAASAKAALLAALAKANVLEVDLAGVDEIDTAGMQILILLKREAAKAGKQLRLQQHSPASMEVLDNYRLGAYFGDPILLSPSAR
jgi:anti-sigma B factor antagonist